MFLRRSASRMTVGRFRSEDVREEVLDVEFELTALEVSAFALDDFPNCPCNHTLAAEES